MIAAVIAAAGLSSRMRGFKPLLCLGGTTIIRRTIEGLRKAGADPILVVTGYQSAVLMRHLHSAGVMFCENKRFAQTDMLESIQMGLAALPKGYDWVFVTPADVPLVSPETMQSMLVCQAQVARPVFQGRGGHPLLLRRDAVGPVIGWRGVGGLKGFLSTGMLSVAQVETDDPAVLMDADTPQDYKRLLQYQNRLQGYGNLRMDLQLNIGVEELFLTMENVQLLDMIAQTGSIRNACACMHISYTKGWKAVNCMERQLGFPVVRRTIGGAEGGGSVLTEQGLALMDGYQRLYQQILEQTHRLFDRYFHIVLPEQQEKLGRDCT